MPAFKQPLLSIRQYNALQDAIVRLDTAAVDCQLLQLGRQAIAEIDRWSSLVSRRPFSVLVLDDTSLTGALARSLSFHHLSGRLWSSEPAMPLQEFIHSFKTENPLLLSGVSGATLSPDAIDFLNQLNLPVISLGLPAGLMSTCGGPVLRSDMTFVIGGVPINALTGNGPDACGAIRILDPDIELYASPTEEFFAFTRDEARMLLTPRPQTSHKNTFGHALLLAGSRQYNGAPFLAAEAALRAGAGLVTLCLPEHARKRPGPASLIVHELKDSDSFSDSHLLEINELMSGKSSFLYGPGISLDSSRLLLAHLLQQHKPVVLDADALTLLAKHPDVLTGRLCPLILTPHKGELSRLLATFAPEGAHYPYENQCRLLAEKLQAVIVCKGHPTWVIDGTTGRQTAILSGGPALATAGTGDVLAGIITALASQYSAIDAACLGAYLHGLAGDLYPHSPRSLIADDLPGLLPLAFRECTIW